MANNVGLKPLFLSGANAKVVWNGLIVAYAANTSYAVATPTIPVEVMGRYEVISHEPISYFVSGSMDVVRYTKFAYEIAAPTKVPSHANQSGNRPEKWATGHFNPAKILASQTCDLYVAQKADQSGQLITQEAFRVTDCRMTSRSSMLDKRGIWFERYTFDGILFVDEGMMEETGYSGDDDLSQA